MLNDDFFALHKKVVVHFYNTAIKILKFAQGIDKKGNDTGGVFDDLISQKM